MAANFELQRVREWSGLRGFTNLLRKENRAWWNTRRWWINAILWSVLICGLLGNMLFIPTVANLASEEEIAQAGSVTAFLVSMGIGVFFEFGIMALAIGMIVLSQDLIISETQSGLAEWLLAKPIARRSYILAKLTAYILPILMLMVGLPSVIGYGMLSLRSGAPFPVIPFLSAVGIMIIHTFFYLTLTLMLGTLFNSRGPVLGIALGSVLGGTFLGGFFKPLLYVTPWMLPKVAPLVAGSQSIPTGMLWPPIIAAVLWSLAFIIVALARFEKTEF